MKKSNDLWNEANTSKDSTSSGNLSNTSNFDIFSKSSKTNKKNFILKSSFFSSEIPKKENIIENAQSYKIPNILNYFNETKEEISKKQTKDFQEERKQKNYILKISSQSMSNNQKRKEVYKLIQNQKKCRYYQERVKNDPEFANNTLYPLLAPFMFKLIVDQFGNYLYQELIEVLNEKNFLHLIEFILGNFKGIAFSQHGTRVIQKILDVIDLHTKKGQEVFELISSKMKEKICQMANDDNATHIIQKCLIIFDCESNSFIYNEIYSYFLSIVTTKQGCCVIQKCLLHGSNEQKMNISKLILKDIKFLLSSQFGNYVCQCLILNSEDSFILVMYNMIYEDFYNFCKGKYSSNVIEKFFDIKNIHIVNYIARNMLQNKPKFIELICNKFGNFIIQKILNSFVNTYLKEQIISLINENISFIEKHPIGQKLLVKLQEGYKINANN